MQINEILKKNIQYFLIIFFIFFLDRLSKYFILKHFDDPSISDIKISSFLSLNLLWNNGIAFGLLQFENGFSYNLITFIIFCVLVIVLILAFKSKGLEKISYLMIVGGGLGNIYDRLNYGSVIDFIDISYKNFNWFIFNVADMFITLSIFILILIEFKKK